MSLACQRHLFEIPSGIAYLDCAYMSPLLRTVREAGEAGVARKAQPWTIRSEDFFLECETARNLVAALIGATADGIGIIPSASYGLAVAAANVPVRPDQRIVVLEGQHPSNTYKWLLGPYSLAFLYVGPQHREGQPLEFNRMARRGSQDIGRAVDYVDAYQPGARRFDVGERSNFILLPMAIAALRQLQAWGVQAIASTLGELTDLIEIEARMHGLQAIPAARRARHMIGLRATEALPPDLIGQLAAAQVFVSLRGQTIRVSPHLYNTQRDIYRLFEVLAAILTSG